MLGVWNYLFIYCVFHLHANFHNLYPPIKRVPVFIFVCLNPYLEISCVLFIYLNIYILFLFCSMTNIICDITVRTVTDTLLVHSEHFSSFFWWACYTKSWVQFNFTFPWNTKSSKQKILNCATNLLYCALNLLFRAYWLNFNIINITFWLFEFFRPLILQLYTFSTKM